MLQCCHLAFQALQDNDETDELQTILGIKYDNFTDWNDFEIFLSISKHDQPNNIKLNDMDIKQAYTEFCI